MFTKATVLATALAMTTLVAPAQAQPRSDVGRYAMQKTDDGFLRLDTKTGSVSLCRKNDDEWSCELVSDDAKKMSAEIESLTRRNAELESEVASLRKNARPGPMMRHHDDHWRDEAPTGPRGDRGPAFRLPTEKEVDKALDYFESMLKKFQDRLKRLEENKPSGPEKSL